MVAQKKPMWIRVNLSQIACRSNSQLALYQSTLEEEPYGDKTDIEKKECVDHVQKTLHRIKHFKNIFDSVNILEIWYLISGGLCKL